ncbi:MAG: hypothetical protein ACRDPF_20260 [Streptosporangiaceae bacterium]
MSIDDQRDLYERLDLAIGAITPREAPVGGAMRRGRGIRLRRRAAVAAGVAVVAAAGVVGVPTLRHADTERPVASYSATVRPPGPHSPPGLIASGTVNGQRWQIVAGRPGAGGAGRGQQIFLASGPALESDSVSTSVPTAALKSKDPVVFLGLSCGPTQVQFGKLRADVSSVRIRLGNGSTLTLHPARVWGARMVAFAIPMGVPVVSATAYSAHGAIATAIPFNDPGGMASFGLWLGPGQHGPARASGSIGSGLYRGSTWSATAYVGPWGVCLEAMTAAGSGACSCIGATSMSDLGTNTMGSSGGGPTAVAFGSAGASVARIVVTAPDGKTTTVPPAAVGAFRFFAFRWARGRRRGSGPRTTAPGTWSGRTG